MIRVEEVTSLALRLTPEPWSFEERNRAAIDQHWKGLVAENPRLWNGRTLLCRDARVEQGRFTADFVEADYASFVAWRDWGRPDASVTNCFGVPAAFTREGALLVGVMADWTLNAGKAYPPAGSLEPKDVRADGSIDLHGNMRSELLEETGLDLAHASHGAMAAIFDGPRLAIVQRLDFPLSFAEITQRFAAHAAAEPQQELARLEALHGADEVDHRMPPYVGALLRHFRG